MSQMERFPIWEDSYENENSVTSVKEWPVGNLDSRHVCTQVVLHNGIKTWAILSQLCLSDSKMTEVLLTIRFKKGQKSFIAPRDIGSDSYMKKRLSAFLEVPYEQIYPITYDISNLLRGDPKIARGMIFDRRNDTLPDDAASKFIVDRIHKDLHKKGYIK